MLNKENGFFLNENNWSTLEKKGKLNHACGSIPFYMDPDPTLYILIHSESLLFFFLVIEKKLNLLKLSSEFG